MPKTSVSLKPMARSVENFFCFLLEHKAEVELLINHRIPYFSIIPPLLPTYINYL